ncbi:uncharacterized protein EAF01_010110 [Botrytis porri]|uniref:uncharacterized protein n=1 Tax=Botrytis porri TaxID=87229 RepID=UPI0019010160|nr:uncharacterized protein EAF01_010110 [Botrytis porri]KAF7894660.1 hypothetical protein EAF01_010110 [Botrytis porri]
MLLAMVTPKPVIDFYKSLETCVEERGKQEQSIEKNSTENERKDMFHYLFQAKVSETGAPAFNHTELVATANLLVTAGSDTTATSLCSAFFYLTKLACRRKACGRDTRNLLFSRRHPNPNPNPEILNDGILAGSRINDLYSLLSPDLWAIGTRGTKKFLLIALMLLLLIILVVICRPASAILMLPSLGWWEVSMTQTLESLVGSAITSKPLFLIGANKSSL